MSVIELNLFCDEIKSKACPITGDKWHYLGILIVPILQQASLLEDILKARYRCENLDTLETGSIYFPKNNKIVHFSELDADTYHIAKRWHDYILNPLSAKKVFFNILGINQNRLRMENFGNRNDFNRIYSRFFRTALVFPLKKYFSNQQILIHNIYHEYGDQIHDKLFPWHSIYRINRDQERINFVNKEIQFLDGDHKTNNLSNFIQLIDVILGTTANVFHDSTIDEHKIRLTKDFFDLIRRLINAPDNYRSKYCKNYSKRMNVDFFPKRSEPKIIEVQDPIGEFYKKRDFLISHHRQERLW
jgi:hypothetical protein